MLGMITQAWTVAENRSPVSEQPTPSPSVRHRAVITSRPEPPRPEGTDRPKKPHEPSLSHCSAREPTGPVVGLDVLVQNLASKRGRFGAKLELFIGPTKVHGA
jgi:hypothetical protein